MRIEAQVQGRTTRVVMDLARELDNVLPFLTYGVSVIPSGAALPFEVEDTIPFGGFGIELSPNQRQPEHGETSELPEGEAALRFEYGYASPDPETPTVTRLDP